MLKLCNILDIFPVRVFISERTIYLPFTSSLTYTGIHLYSILHILSRPRRRIQMYCNRSLLITLSMVYTKWTLTSGSEVQLAIWGDRRVVTALLSWSAVLAPWRITIIKKIIRQGLINQLIADLMTRVVGLSVCNVYVCKSVTLSPLPLYLRIHLLNLTKLCMNINIGYVPHLIGKFIAKKLSQIMKISKYLFLKYLV